MSKASKEAIARLDGMDYALRRIREKGIEDFEREMRWRNENGISLPLTQQTINEGSWKIKARTIDTTLCMAMLVLHDEFGFGKAKLERFRERFNLKTACMGDDMVSWGDFRKILKDECGIEMEIRFE